MNYKQLLLALLLGFSLLINNGCPALLVGGAAGAGTGAYIGGELKSTQEVSLNRAWKATQMAMDDLKFHITGKEKDVFGAKRAVLPIRKSMSHSKDSPITSLKSGFASEYLVMNLIRGISLKRSKNDSEIEGGMD